MIGVDAITGRVIEGEQHLAQSIACILTTPIGTREQRRDFGSLLPELIDQPLNGATRTLLYGATATALMRWEPRLRLTRVDLVVGDTPGSFVLNLEGDRTDAAPANARSRLTIPLRFRTS
ncbi:GPW/gp25 family protein [Xanthomonas oryzae pv. oryzae]|uniref:GPW/gp25 family protein n=1 Tax=Xanthomonas oryzae TaxID=347 RepID=UPI000859982F|nr:GPW/gp25 family protein [Xanthomonas oryzae]AOS18622.1 baseplate assembly protein [Xanthomonas oryzae pv. oryzae]AOS22791.1 baseplate assembly protein [Xanthomonas oryzae pv. oryzae]AZK85841.1 baseplate assembly protein [Xanthomonas oryzae pv. oryzae]OLH97489.1 baseplate assembly protein [Xanthomonas oryzae pv. oryzae]PNR79195.1 baseplate assembly protein [Xanthomonas oryzae pv. oryzae]